MPASPLCPLCPGLVSDRVPAYQPAGQSELRALDPTEHNMERLNALARGSGRSYLFVVVQGQLSHAALERTVDAVASRHPLMRARIARSADGTLHFTSTRDTADDRTGPVPVTYTAVDDLSVWPDLLAEDLNAGSIASDSGPLFGFAVIEPRSLADGADGERVIVLIGHHAASDGISSVAVLRELLEGLSTSASPPPLENAPLADPFHLDVPVPELGELESAVQGALARPERRAGELEGLGARLEELEGRLLSARDGAGHFPSALKRVHALLSSIEAALSPARGIVPEENLGTGPARYTRASTAFLRRGLPAESTRALRRGAKEHGVSLHGALAAAMLVALAAEGPAADRIALATAVSLRNGFSPPLASHDLRMAVDILVSRLAVDPKADFWELARRAGEDVRRSVDRARALSSYFRTVPRSFAETPPGVPLPLLTNLGAAELDTRYGPFHVRDLGGAMTTHGSFQLVLLALTFDECLRMSFYCETPTVSRATLERFAGRVQRMLESVAAGRGAHVG